MGLCHIIYTYFQRQKKGAWKSLLEKEDSKISVNEHCQCQTYQSKKGKVIGEQRKIKSNLDSQLNKIFVLF